MNNIEIRKKQLFAVDGFLIGLIQRLDRENRDSITRNELVKIQHEIDAELTALHKSS